MSKAVTTFEHWIQFNLRNAMAPTWPDEPDETANKPAFAWPSEPPGRSRGALAKLKRRRRRHDLDMKILVGRICKKHIFLKANGYWLKANG